LEGKEFKTLILEEKQNVLRIILDRPDKMNALNAEMSTELRSVLDRVDRVVDAILAGNATGLLELSQ
jgi:enoyl-CoA hydratase/carnithine racemase